MRPHTAARPSFSLSLRSLTLSLSLALPLGLAAGCVEPQPAPGGAGESTDFETDALSSENGLKAINGMKVNNGLASGNGLNISASLKTSAGLNNGSGLMASVDGRTTVAYLVRCALPAGHAISKLDAEGDVHTYAGQIGLAPEWESGTCGPSCQRWISACMLSLVNTTGMHYPLWMAAQNPTIGWGLDPDYPFQEGAFFGNVFTSPPAAYFCGGRDFGVSPIPGRIGGMQGPTPYTNIYGARGLCSSTCTPADAPHAHEGFKACSGWNEVINIWHE
jgi:hypothetical protein